MGDPPRTLLGAPGLRSWAGATAITLLALAGAAIASIFVEAHWNAEVDAFVAQEVKAIESIPPADQRKGRAVVIFGTSLIAAATQRGDLPPGQLPPSIQLVILPRGPASPLWLESLVPAIQRAHPDLVLLEANLLDKPYLIPPLESRLHHLEWALFWHPDQKADAQSCPGIPPRKSAQAGHTAEQYQAWFSPDYIDLYRLPILLELKAAGIQAGVLDMPRATELEDAAPNLKARHKALETALAQQGIDAWHAPGFWPVEYFCDMAHVNRDGAIAFNSWFSHRLQQALNLPQ